MTEKEIQLLGFKRTDDNSDGANPYYYYTYDVTNGLSFITNSNDATEDCEWYVEFFETEIPIRFFHMEETRALINTILRAKISK